MTDRRISEATTTAMRDIDQTSDDETDFRRTVSTADQDAPGTVYCPDWKKWFGYYKNVPELQAVINKKAIWTLGRGYQARPAVQKVLDRIKGCGKDTFNDIMFNLVVTYTACGDAFAEIVRNRRGELINLKPINPGSLKVRSNSRGIITRYDQTVIPMDFEKKAGVKVQTLKFHPRRIFHLPWNRLGDECHGRSTIEKLQWIIEATEESKKDLRIVFHRYVKPLVLSKIDSDDENEIKAFKAKLDKAVRYMENMVVPKDTVDMERFSIPQYSTLDPLPWLEILMRYFLIAEGVPEVILGYGRDTTEASAKILYLAFQQNIEHNQRFLEQQIKAQLKLDIEFNFPENLAQHMEEDKRKEGPTKAHPVTPGKGRK